ncbi:MAG: hypothetical protein Q8868_00970 [Bacteroidota bacterium]|nr:hypothetical protein [Bacteroidota bacterium]
MRDKIIGMYSIFIGISVLAMWTLIILKGNVPEGKTELSFHLFSEFLMALVCIISGAFVIRKSSMGKHINMFGLGMVVYSVLNAAGYYGEKGSLAMMSIFIVLFILTLIAVFMHFLKKSSQ